MKRRGNSVNFARRNASTSRHPLRWSMTSLVVGLTLAMSTQSVLAMSAKVPTSSSSVVQTLEKVTAVHSQMNDAADERLYPRLMTINEDWNIQRPQQVVTGQVLDKQGQPAANAVVLLGNAAWGFASTTTNADGFYQFSDVPQGTYRVLARYAFNQRSAGTSLDMGESTLTVESGRLNQSNVTLSMVGSSLSGVITNATNRLRMLGLVQMMDGSNQVIWEGFSNLNGMFDVELPAGHYKMKVFVGHATRVQSVSLLPSTKTSVCVVVPMTAMMGTVRSSSGTAVLNAWVYAFDKFGNVVARTLTDIHGQYLINGLVPGEYSVKVMKGNELTSKGNIEVKTHVTTTVNLALP